MRLWSALAITFFYAVPALAGGDPVKGKAAFARCQICHAVQPGVNRVGPSLANIFDTKAGEVKGFNFSPAMKASKIIWNEQTLDAFLAKPMERIPGNRMAFGGVPDPQDRANIIAYLQEAGK